jgi:hypothetical protein
VNFLPGDLAHLTPQQQGEALRARKEMLNHIGQRVVHTPSRRQMKRYMAEGARSVWREMLRLDAAPRRNLYMPGKGGARA